MLWATESAICSLVMTPSTSATRGRRFAFPYLIACLRYFVRLLCVIIDSLAYSPTRSNARLGQRAEVRRPGTAVSATQCRSNRVSSRRLPETGIFQISAGDCRRFLPGIGQIWSLETDRKFAKARHWRAFLVLLRVKSLGAGLVGWGGRIRTTKG